MSKEVEIKLRNETASLSIYDYFKLRGIKVLSIEETPSGFASRCKRILVEDSNKEISAYHIKWMIRESKANKSQIEPIASNLLLEYGIPTPEVLMYLPAGALTDNIGSDSCIISKYFDPSEQTTVQLETIRKELNQDEILSITKSFAQILAKIHRIPQNYGIQHGLTRNTDVSKAMDTIIKSYRYGFLEDDEMYRVQKEMELIKSDDLVLVHKDAYSENLLVDSKKPNSISAIVDLEHMEFSGLGQEIYALDMFYFPRMGGEKTKQYFWENYCRQNNVSYSNILIHGRSYGIARAAEVYLIGIENNIPSLISTALSYKNIHLEK